MGIVKIKAASFVLAWLGLAVAFECVAAVDRYDYDPLGRLIRRVDGEGKASEYNYDAAGNILNVTSGGTVAPPSVSGIAPASAARNKIVQVVVSGDGLTGASVASDDPEIVPMGVVASKNAVSFRLSVSPRAALGSHVLTFRNAAGSTTAGFEVLPALPYELYPSPVQLAPDGISRKATLRLGQAVLEATTVTISTASPAVAKPKAGQLLLQPGQSEATFGVIGVAQGVTLLRLRLPDMAEPLEYMVFVDPGFSSGLLAYSSAIGIAKGVPWSLSSGAHVISGAIGIAKGVPWSVSSAAMVTSGGVGISRGVPWSVSSGAHVHSGSIGIAKGVPWSVSPGALVTSGSVGLAKGVPWSVSTSAGPLIAPLVGVIKP